MQIDSSRHQRSCTDSKHGLYIIRNRNFYPVFRQFMLRFQHDQGILQASISKNTVNFLQISSYLQFRDSFSSKLSGLIIHQYNFQIRINRNNNILNTAKNCFQVLAKFFFLLFQRLLGFKETILLKSHPGCTKQLLLFYRFGKIIKSSKPDSLRSRLNIRVTGNHHYRTLLDQLFSPAQEINS